MRKVISLVLIIVILINFLVLDISNRNKAYAEIVVSSALAIKLFASVLAGMGVYLASSSDYKVLYNMFEESHIGQLSQYGSLMRNLLIHRIAVDVKGRYEFIRDFINSLDFTSSSSYQKVPIKKIGVDVPISHKGVISDGYTVSVSDGYVFSVGHNIIKTVATDSGYDIYTRTSGGKYNRVAGILNNTNELVFKEDWSSGNKTVYQMYYKSDDILCEAGGGVSVYSDIVKPDDDIDFAESICVDIKKGTDIVDLPKTTIGVMADSFTGDSYPDLDTFINDLDNVSYFDDYYLERLYDEYDIDYTDVISESIALEYVPVRDLDTYPPIPGVSDPPIDIPDVDNPDIPVDPSIPIDPSFPIDDSIPIPDESVLDESPVDDDGGSKVLGLGLISRLLKFIGNLLKLAIVTPINIIKSGIIAIYDVLKSIPAHFTNVIDYIKDIPTHLTNIISHTKDIPGKLSEILTGVLSIPTWLGNILDKVGSIPAYLEGVYTQVIDGIISIPTTITTTYETVKDWVISLPESIAEKWENSQEKIQEKVEEVRVKFFEPTKSIDLSPLQVVTVKDKFPFCLPFDFMNVFEQLNSSPEVPQWEINILGSSISIDFSQFEQLAVIVRWAVVVIFVIALIKFYSTLFL